jgi:hypothetical protein
MRTSFVLTRLDTVQPLPSSSTGIKTPGGQHPHGLGAHLVKWIDRIEDELYRRAYRGREVLRPPERSRYQLEY